MTKSLAIRVSMALAVSATGVAAAAPAAPAMPIAERAAALGPGQFVWEADRVPSGPVLMTIDLTAQRMTVYRGGVLVAASAISTGSAGRETPTGVFTVLQKEVMHRSTTYDDAPMPFMQRLTEKGIAIHAGDLPGYPASHGCIRLPNEFAKKLFAITDLGTPVMITDDTEIAAERRQIEEYANALKDFARTRSTQQEAANQALINFNRAQAAHMQKMRAHAEEMERYRAQVAPK